MLGRNSPKNAEANRSKARKDPVFAGLLDAEGACASAEKVLSDRLSPDVQKLGFEPRGQPYMSEEARCPVRLGRKGHDRKDLFSEGDSVDTVRRKRESIANIQPR